MGILQKGPLSKSEIAKNLGRPLEPPLIGVFIFYGRIHKITGEPVICGSGLLKI